MDSFLVAADRGSPRPLLGLHPRAVRNPTLGYLSSSQNKPLEDELQPKLYLAWRPSAADFGVAGLGAGLAKLDGAAAARVNRLPLRVIERVERLRSELDGGVLTPKPGRLEFLVERQVPIVPAGTG